MPKSLKALAAALTACALLSSLAASPAAAREIPARDQVKAMTRGINVLGYDPIWKDPAKARFQMRHFKVIKDGGFDAVRLNLHAFSHMDADNRLDPAWLATLDQVVKAALDQKLTVILDEHNFGDCGNDPATCKPKLVAFWKQVGERYKDAPDGVVFELLNEPNKGLTDELWNAWIAELLPVVRASNPTRNVIVGPAFWNNISHLDQLKLPQGDRHLIATVHYYLPMEFTHQGAAWNPDTPKTGVTWGAPAERARMKADFDGVQAWAKANDRPMLLGEFGAYDRGDMASRAAYTAAAAREAEARGWAWSYWQFDSDFIAYDIKADAWVTPIHDALVPK
ncbi:glycoside hydrolase family 5 protein [Caulobacter sp. UNC358MFTsu5.1]|uniref:glycoside hydrolase family 5 protein n=1 Tax=Caulobacter sp. UNC358MFTsu5.1 TaxID=1449049 RepID=UPI0004A73576|nr:glycoside hydrolase family 5 protein [Caulobacter sp. UNC358MFTsu5.1]